MEGQLQVVMRLPKEKPQEAGEPKKPAQKRKSDILNTRGLDLFDKLRELRLVIAREESVPPYIVFSDKTLVDMCVKLPFSREEMLSVNGVGENKYQKYGQRFQEAVYGYMEGRKEKLYFGE